MNKRKLALVREFMSINSVDTLLLQRSNNFAWLTDGAASYIGIASDIGPSSILITKDFHYVLTNNIEALHLKQEQGLSDWDFLVSSWIDGQVSNIKKLSVGVIGSDYFFPEARDISSLFAPLRYDLDELELKRYRELGLATGRALQKAAREILPGMSENEIAGLVAKYCYAEQIIPIVNLVATDERIFKYRHPLPTEKKLDKHATLVVGGRKWGLVASATRSVYFGSLPDQLRKNSEACARIDAAYISATKEGVTLRDVFWAGAKAYEKEGHAESWQIHHQGGLAGYTSREILAKPNEQYRLKKSQAFAWNPILPGVKSEDTILLTSNGIEVITQVDKWPFIDCNGLTRPDILVL